MKGLHSLGRQIQGRWRQFAQTIPVADASARKRSGFPRPLSVAVAVACLTGTIGQRFYNQPELDVGMSAPFTVIAPESAEVIDEKSTEENRRDARIATTPILTIDAETDREILKNLERRLEQGDRLRETAGSFPFVDRGILSTVSQRYLRQVPSWKWDAIRYAIGDGELLAEPGTSQNDTAEIDPLAAVRQGTLTGVYRGIVNLIEQPNAEVERVLQELQAYRERASTTEFASLIGDIDRARSRYERARSELETMRSAQDDVFYTSEILNLSDSQWRAARSHIQDTAKQILAQGIPAGLPDDLLGRAIALQLPDALPKGAQKLARRLLLAVLDPNLIQDSEQTRARAEQAAQQVDPVVVTIEKGEVIVEVGEEITQADFVLLDRFGRVRRTLVDWPGLIGFGGLVTAGVGIFLIVERRFNPRASGSDRLLVLLLALSAPLVALLRVPTTSLPAVGLLAGSFYGSPVGIALVAIVGSLLAVGLEIEASYLIAGVAGGVVGGVLAGRLRSREELALLGAGVGLTQGTLHLIVNLVLSAAAGPVWPLLLGSAALQAASGLAWSVLALGVSPYLEHLFDLVTPIRLAELANPNRATLKRLAAETPGTFQHTLFVASLAEAAAGALGCNVELVRAGTLYHDIGKMHDPLGFCENQMGGRNKHDDIDDPWISAEIIKKHVTQGLVMARKCRLPKAVRAFIPEHQGTMLISYFFYQAQQLHQQGDDRPVREEDFRYDGPIPQSRETGIVMLADSCEAALRSLEDATPEQALNMVNKIMRARWQDDQLVDSGLTREDLAKVAEIFVQVWQRFNHKRVAYPKAALSARK